MLLVFLVPVFIPEGPSPQCSFPSCPRDCSLRLWYLNFLLYPTPSLLLYPQTPAEANLGVGRTRALLPPNLFVQLLLLSPPGLSVPHFPRRPVPDLSSFRCGRCELPGMAAGSVLRAEGELSEPPESSSIICLSSSSPLPLAGACGASSWAFS